MSGRARTACVAVVVALCVAGGAQGLAIGVEVEAEATEEAIEAALERVEAKLSRAGSEAARVLTTAREVVVGVAQTNPPSISTVRNIELKTGGARPSVVAVRSSGEDGGVSNETTADLEVMARILEKELQGNPPSWFVEPPLCVYLEGQGALFVVGVPFSLTPADDGFEEPSRPHDPLWQETVRELMGAEHLGEAGPVDLDAAELYGFGKRAVATLKHASNIRGLGSEDVIGIAIVQAGSEAALLRAVSRYGVGGDNVAPGQTVSIQLSEADVDALAAGEVTVDALTDRPDPKGWVVHEDPESLEDLAIMSRILVRAAPGWGVDKSLYVDGYGALFLLSSPVPLSEPDTAADDSEWERAKRELRSVRPFIGGPGTVVFPSGHALGVDQRVFGDAGDVDEAVESLVEALQYATNIQSVKPDECVAVVVYGPTLIGGAAFDAPSFFHARGASGEVEGDIRVLLRGPGRAPGRAMTIHATKEDIDLSAEGAITIEEFRTRATVATY